MNPQDPPERRTVVALYYDGKNAPRVTAKGQGYVAEEILAIARQHNIPLHDDAALVSLLARLELGDRIPEKLYVAVAEVIAFAWRLRGKWPTP